ncbi:bifunctional (p)ppGpp synthetase/guanosine-3',5'-bis(diphosphate) 3'-pyrophosphohydrolase [Sulfuriferula sp.]|uniref:RelA/SpoT family protein n=1 Tax=Sulfuriferula sp. TaxID=2025307 RepID=UPI00272FF80E|nr:bifunctional (p)ppGpp synthetase/guanosine-3',5'-bis(diphosphate) 3'-pyrophosphohydrolase [Sulfuriferula sp.]MDP2025037.1 bifunctional (p)ppGpp synthetase/guanosine-3',5'-bis(diphosphate) 3'-pyrophosphohydrolase [Sulfuriferula sp.]
MPEIDEILSELAYLKPEDAEQVRRAFEFSRQAHSGQFRKSGEAYIHHPVAVAGILAQWHLDPQALMAALLHDVVEDTPTTKTQIGELFGKSVAELVDGVSKLDKLEFQTEAHAQAENFRKMLLAMARDVRVILIKLADRLHNMRTLGSMAEEKRHRIAQETLDIYAPIANRLGLNSIYQELEDLCFQNLHPNRYKVLDKAVRTARGNRKEVVEKVRIAIQDKLIASNIHATVSGREKHLFSIYKKMQEKSLAFSEVFDIYGFRVLVDDIPSCYLALGAMHGLYKPIPGKFKDYLAIPKANGYQSLHTTLFGPFGTPIEIQIRTQEMHKLAEAGVASHWLYKSSDTGINEVQQKTHQWLQSLLEIQEGGGDSAEFLEHIKVDLFPDEVYVFTPKGKILSLPRGATAVDFAYAVHTDVGNHCSAVKVNGELMPMRTQLRNGDQVEVLTSPNASPNPAWINFVVSGKARAHIRHYLRTLHAEESAQLGGRLLDQALRALGGDPAKVQEKCWERLFKETGKTRDEVLTDIGLGKRLNVVVARQLLAQENGQQMQQPHGAIAIRGSEGVAVQLAKCCHPIPGDPIIGFIKSDQGLVIHTHDCPSIRHYRDDPDKWLDVEWEPGLTKMFDVNIKLIVLNQRGVLAKLAAAIADEGSNIDNVAMEEEDGSQYTTIFFTLQVEQRMHLARIMRALRRLPEVVRIMRVKNRKDGRAQTQ